jgi:hypothetical protein
MAKRNLGTTGSDSNKTPERRRRTTESTGTTPAAPKARTRRKTDGPIEITIVATAADRLVADPQAPAAAASATPIEAPVSQGPLADPLAAVPLSHEQIALRAYHIYLERGGQPGDQFLDWVTAERQLREQLALNG